MIILITLLHLMALGQFRALRNSFFLLHLVTLGGCFYFLQDKANLNVITTESAIIVLLLHFLSTNCATFFLYKIDKNAAKEGNWRIPEKTLHAFALIGGIPGALLARKIFHHKTKKQSFIKEFWGVALFQLAILFAIFLLVDFMRP